MKQWNPICGIDLPFLFPRALVMHFANSNPTWVSLFLGYLYILARTSDRYYGNWLGQVKFHNLLFHYRRFFLFRQTELQISFRRATREATAPTYEETQSVDCAIKPLSPCPTLYGLLINAMGTALHSLASLSLLPTPAAIYCSPLYPVCQT